MWWIPSGCLFSNQKHKKYLKKRFEIEGVSVFHWACFLETQAKHCNSIIKALLYEKIQGFVNKF